MNVQFLKQDAVQRYTLGIVYPPDEADTGGDWASAEEIEKACWDFNQRLWSAAQETRKRAELLTRIVAGEEVTLEVDEPDKDDAPGLGLMHVLRSDMLGSIVESYIAPADFEIGDGKVKKGSWMMGVVWQPSIWDAIEKGTLTGYSMGGTAQRRKAEVGTKP